MTSPDWFQHEQVQPQPPRRRRRRSPWVNFGGVVGVLAIAALSGLLYDSNDAASGWKSQAERRTMSSTV